MKSIGENYQSKYEIIHSIFNDTMKELFLNQHSCEETELHFILIENINESVYVYLDGAQLPEKKAKEIISTEHSMLNEDFINKELNTGHKYIWNKSYISDDSRRTKKIFWILCSECLDSNRGRLMLEIVFKCLVNVFNNYIKNSEENCIDKSEQQTNNNVFIVHNILENAVTEVDKYLEGMFAPFNIDFVSSISGEYYEKSECMSNMAFLSHSLAERLDQNIMIHHLEEVNFIPSNRRLIRKLLQIAQEDLCLVMEETGAGDSKLFKAIGICNEDLMKKNLAGTGDTKSPYVRVVIKKHMQWDMFLDDIYLLTCKNGQHKIDCPLDEKYLRKKLSGYFGERDDDYRDLIANVLRSTKQGHGTMLVITDDINAKKQAERLGKFKYGLPESRPKIHTEEINYLNAIDGSIIMDLDGKIYGIGMILDGIAIKEGSLARGARYNSAIKYRNYLNENENGTKALILIVSEDGPVDIILV